MTSPDLTVHGPPTHYVLRPYFNDPPEESRNCVYSYEAPDGATVESTPFCAAVRRSRDRMPQDVHELHVRLEYKRQRMLTDRLWIVNATFLILSDPLSNCIRNFDVCPQIATRPAHLFYPQGDKVAGQWWWYFPLVEHEVFDWDRSEYTLLSPEEPVRIVKDYRRWILRDCPAFDVFYCDRGRYVVSARLYMALIAEAFTGLSFDPAWQPCLESSPDTH